MAIYTYLTRVRPTPPFVMLSDPRRIVTRAIAAAAKAIRARRKGRREKKKTEEK